MAINEFMTEDDYKSAFDKNNSLRVKTQGYLDSLRQNAGTDYEWSLYIKPVSELTEQERALLAMDWNEYIEGRRNLAQRVIKNMKELNKRKVSLKKEYDTFNTQEIDGIMSDDKWTVSPANELQPDEVVLDNQPPRPDGLPSDRYENIQQNMWVTPAVAWQNIPWATTLQWADGNIVGQTWVQQWAVWQIVPWFNPEIWDTFQKSFQWAIDTGQQAIGSVNKQAQAELKWAALWAAKEWGYIKGLSTRTGSTMWEKWLAQDRQSAAFREQAAKIRAAQQQWLQQAYGNISNIQKDAAAKQADMEDARLQRVQDALRYN